MQIESGKNIDLVSLGQNLRVQYGLGKEMARGVRAVDEPKFMLQRKFLGEEDLVIIFNTPGCAFSCDFCNLPSDSLSRAGIIFTPNDIRTQFMQAAVEMRHTWHILDRLTLSNDGSVLDEKTFPREALLDIVRFANVYKNIHTLVLETRLEFVDPDFIGEIQRAASMAKVNILTGFETHDDTIRTEILGKEPIEKFLEGLDRVASATDSFTAHVLYKPDYKMTNDEAYREAERSILFLVEECRRRNLDLTVRLNPMYNARGTSWTVKAREYSWQPPELSHVLELATEMRKQEINVYIGLSSENLADETGTYSASSDYSRKLLKEAILLNAYPSYLPY